MEMVRSSHILIELKGFSDGFDVRENINNPECLSE